MKKYVFLIHIHVKQSTWQIKIVFCQLEIDLAVSGVKENEISNLDDFIKFEHVLMLIILIKLPLSRIFFFYFSF